MDVARTAIRHGSRHVTCFARRDTVSVSQGAMNRVTSTTKGLETDKRGLLIADENGQTTRPGVFTSGDVVSGAKTVVEVVAASKKTAEAIHEYLQSLAAEN